MRVMHFISGDLWAGAEAMAATLNTELHASPDLQLLVLLLNDGRLAEVLTDAGVEVVVLNEAQHSFASLIATARGLTNRFRPQLIHAHRYKENILAGLASDFGRKIRLLTTQHGLPEKESGRGGLIASLNRRLLRHRFAKIVGVSEAIRSYFLDAVAIPSDRLTVIHNGIALPDQVIRHAATSRLHVGSAGRLFPVKDYALMIDIAHCVNQTAPGTRFSLAGDGPLRTALEKQVRDCGMSASFALPGHSAAMSQFYRQLDVYLNTSLHEGIPMSILEAMAHGLPVVAPNVGGISEMIDHGVDGFLVTERTPEAFAAPLLQLQDVALRRRIGTAAREKVRTRFSAQKMTAAYLRLYQELIA